jgi:hypothetical protein
MNKNVIEQYNERKQEALQTHLMPTEMISCKWFEAAIRALWNTSPMALGITPTALATLYFKDMSALTLMDFAILSNNLESKSAKDLDWKMSDYLMTLQDGEQAVKQWQSIVADIDESIKQQLAQEALKIKDQAGDQPVGSFISKPAEA